MIPWAAGVVAAVGGVAGPVMLVMLDIWHLKKQTADHGLSRKIKALNRIAGGAPGKNCRPRRRPRGRTLRLPVLPSQRFGRAQAAW
jgi:hypothetical protein